MIKRPKTELTNSLFDAMGFAVYRGCIVEKLIGSFRIFGKDVKTIGEVDKLIDEALKSLEKSIKR